ncbi:MAG: hypothetical protein JNK12_10055 [Acidimicrobiales bacterium]|nr:hypothetical protein [Acidimicrobiales bacterium]
MSERRGPSYGTPNFEMISRWFQLPPEDDTPFWAVNLMKYKARADYGDDGDQGRTGREADDAYTPYGPLAEIGAMIAFAGDVVEQRGSSPTWDRIGIVRYPHRAGFFAMQQRDDFKDQHVHKEAGMEATIVMSCLPVEGAPLAATPDGGTVVLRVRRFPGEAPADERLPDGITPLSRFAVEGVIVGDDRTWHEVRFDHVAEGADGEALLDLAGTEEGFAVVVTPTAPYDRLVESIETADDAPKREA